jgi:hypothetical protein
MPAKTQTDTRIDEKGKRDIRLEAAEKITGERFDGRRVREENTAA